MIIYKCKEGIANKYALQILINKCESVYTYLSIISSHNFNIGYLEKVINNAKYIYFQNK